MANPEHLAILKQGVEEWNKWRKEHPDIRPDLTEAKLRGAQLMDASLEGVDLSRAELPRAILRKARLATADIEFANLSAADLSQADLSNAHLQATSLYRAELNKTILIRAGLGRTDLSGALLSGANLSLANLSRATLRGANLNEANLHGAHLFRANLSGAVLNLTNFTAAQFDATVLANVDLRNAEGLEHIAHYGPSTVGVDTIYKSKGKIPEVFLRGCGVPDEVIQLAQSIGRNPIEYYSCFISYSSKDQVFADRLYADLQAKGVRCWFAAHDIMGGRKIHEQIDEAIRVHDKLLLILSEHSMASDWVGTEIADAREREAREKKQMLFPITLAPFEEVRKWKKFDAELGSDSAKAVREYYIPDFSGWESDRQAYQKEFEKLVTALKAGVSG